MTVKPEVSQTKISAMTFWQALLAKYQAAGIKPSNKDWVLETKVWDQFGWESHFEAGHDFDGHCDQKLTVYVNGAGEFDKLGDINYGQNHRNYVLPIKKAFDQAGLRTGSTRIYGDDLDQFTQYQLAFFHDDDKAADFVIISKRQVASYWGSWDGFVYKPVDSRLIVTNCDDGQTTIRKKYRGRWVPVPIQESATLILDDFLAANSLVFNEVLAQQAHNLNTPVTWDDVLVANNLGDILPIKYAKQVATWPRSVRSYYLVDSYILHRVQPYLTRAAYARLQQQVAGYYRQQRDQSHALPETPYFDFSHCYVHQRNSFDYVAQCLTYAMTKRATINFGIDLSQLAESEQNAVTYELDDLWQIMHQLRQKITLQQRSLGGVRARHDELALRVRDRQIKHAQRKFKFPDWSQNLLKRLKAPEYNDRLYVLPSPKALIMESQLMNNCVATYVDRVQTGRCIVLHYVSDDQSATVEVTWRRNKLHLQQMLGPGNRALAHEHLQFVRDILASVEGGESIGH